MPRPNILLFHRPAARRYHPCACNPVVRTPNLDRLCAEGVAFTMPSLPRPCVFRPGARCTMAFIRSEPMYENGGHMPTDVGRLRGFVAAGRLSHPRHRQLSFSLPTIGPSVATDARFSRGVGQHAGAGRLSEVPVVERLQAYLRPMGIRARCTMSSTRADAGRAASDPVGWDRAIDFLSQQKADQPWHLFCSFVHPIRLLPAKSCISYIVPRRCPCPICRRSTSPCRPRSTAFRIATSIAIKVSIRT